MNKFRILKISDNVESNAELKESFAKQSDNCLKERKMWYKVTDLV